MAEMGDEAKRKLLRKREPWEDERAHYMQTYSILLGENSDAMYLQYACQDIVALKNKIAELESKLSEIKSAIRLLDHITDGTLEPTGNEPEWICQIVERFIQEKRGDL